MKEQLRWTPLLVLFMLALASCGQVPEPPAASTPVPVPAWPTEAQPLVDLVLADLAKEPSDAKAQAEIVRVEAVDWPNGCLGCAKKGEMCTDAIVPGYRIIAQVDDETYEYHTDKKQTVRRCQPEDDAGDWGAATPLVRLAITDVMTLLAVPASEVQVVSVEQKDWNDSSLGCPESGKAYLTVITPGYQIILEVKGQRYDYRTSDKLVRLCTSATQ